MKTKKKGLSTSFIKTVALICMFVDHLGATLMWKLAMNPLHPVMLFLNEKCGGITAASELVGNIYTVMRYIGRVSFPIYCFFIVEGMIKTRNRKKYARRLGACALISEIPFDLALEGTVIDFGHQNVFFTLLLGMFAIWVIDSFTTKKEWDQLKIIALSMMSGIGFMLVAELMMTDYSSVGVAVIIAMYLVRRFTEKKIKYWAPVVYVTGVALLCFMGMNEAWALLTLPLFFFYHGKKGWNAKWFFYLFYPVHLLVLAILCLCLGLKGWSFM